MIRDMKRLAAVAAAVLMTVCLGAAGRSGSKPFVIPELKSWDAGTGAFIPEESFRIAVPSGDAELLRVAGILASDWETLSGYRPEVISEKGGKGDIILTIKNDNNLKKLSGGSDECYSLDISDRVRLSGPTVKGVFWGLQMADNSLRKTSAYRDSTAGSGRAYFPCGRILDWPEYGLRGFMMDCGRKYIPMSYLRKLTRIMAYYKMNTLQVHLNDNGFKQYFGGDWDRTYAAFRLECDTYPGLTARDGHYLPGRGLRHVRGDNT